MKQCQEPAPAAAFARRYVLPEALPRRAQRASSKERAGSPGAMPAQGTQRREPALAGRVRPGRGSAAAAAGRAAPTSPAASSGACPRAAVAWAPARLGASHPPLGSGGMAACLHAWALRSEGRDHCGEGALHGRRTAVNLSRPAQHLALVCETNQPLPPSSGPASSSCPERTGEARLRQRPCGTLQTWSLGAHLQEGAHCCAPRSGLGSATWVAHMWNTFGVTSAHISLSHVGGVKGGRGRGGTSTVSKGGAEVRREE